MAPRSLLTAVLVGLSGATVLGLAGCAPEPASSAGAIDTGWFTSTPGEEILSAAAETMQSATSFLLEQRARSEEGVLSKQLSVTDSGDCSGELQLPAWGEPAELVVRDGEGAFRGDRSFWSTFGDDVGARAGLADAYGERWTTTPGLAALCDVEELLRPVVKASRAEAITKDGLGDVDGAPAGRVVTERGEAVVTLWVALAEPHQVLRIGVQHSSDGAPLEEPGDSVTTFADLDAPVEVDFPAPEDIETFALPEDS
ncbi:hypothetical protein BH11ACT8_BH11ACT8_33510 [soil metagenome]